MVEHILAAIGAVTVALLVWRLGVAIVIAAAYARLG
jgi:hypothetical protein